MKNFASAGLLGLAACLATPALAQTNIAYPTDGYIGVFGDIAATNCCITLPPNAATTLHIIAVTGGQTSAGITGAEFRVEVSPPAPGALLVWTPAPASNVTIGNPIDNTTTAGDASGVNVAFPTCQKQLGMAGDHIELGTLLIFGMTGEHALLVKQHNHPSNPNMKSALMVLCDAPNYTIVPLTLLDGDPKLFGQEPICFRTPINSATCDGSSCGAVSVQSKTWSSVKDLYR